MQHMADPIEGTTPTEWNDWLAAHPLEREVWVLFHKKATSLPSLTWEQALIEALAYGWIEGIKKSVRDTQWIVRLPAFQTSPSRACMSCCRGIGRLKLKLSRPRSRSSRRMLT
jgi:hypothetical protein